jgi:hypothetical protein
MSESVPLWNNDAVIVMPIERSVLISKVAAEVLADSGFGILRDRVEEAKLSGALRSLANARNSPVAMTTLTAAIWASTSHKDVRVSQAQDGPRLKYSQDQGEPHSNP